MCKLNQNLCQKWTSPHTQQKCKPWRAINQAAIMRNNYLKTENYYFLITHFDATRRRSGSTRCKKTCLLCPQTCEMNICLINTTQDMQASVSINQKTSTSARGKSYKALYRLLKMKVFGFRSLFLLGFLLWTGVFCLRRRWHNIKMNGPVFLVVSDEIMSRQTGDILVAAFESICG